MEEFKTLEDVLSHMDEEDKKEALHDLKANAPKGFRLVYLNDDTMEVEEV